METPHFRWKQGSSNRLELEIFEEDRWEAMMQEAGTILVNHPSGILVQGGRWDGAIIPHLCELPLIFVHDSD